ncbi:hypothetical protein ACWGJ9_01020 [Curtobacterium citreum]
MPQVVVGVPFTEVPELFRQAVHAVQGATLIEVLEDRALVGRRTTFAARSETTRFTFHARSETTSEIRAESTNGGVFGVASYPGIVLEIGRAVLNELERAAAPKHG